MTRFLVTATALALAIAPASAQTGTQTGAQTGGQAPDQTGDTAAPMHHRHHHGMAKRMAQSGDTTGARPGHEPGVGDSYPASNKASNIGQGDTRSSIAPRLPTPAAGEGAGPEAYLRDAQRAIAAKRTGEAQEALERAQTRLLDRSVPQGETGTAASDPMVSTVEQARQALGRGDMAGAARLIKQALGEA